MEYTLCMTDVNFDEHNSLNKMPVGLFYKNMLQACIRFNNMQDSQPHCICEVKKQRLWENKYIILNGKSLFCKTWIDSNLKTMEDVIVDTRIKNLGEIIPHLSKTQNGIIEYMALINAIPKMWKNIVVNQSYCLQHRNNDCNTNYTPISIYKRRVNDFYLSFLNVKYSIPSAQNKWEIELQNNTIVWELCWTKKMYSMLHMKNIAQFNFKFLHRILPTKNRLKIWRLSITNLCEYCNFTENEEHMLFKCKGVKLCWMKFHIMSQSCFKISDKLQWNEIVLGSSEERVNEIVSILTFCIYKSKIMHRLGVGSKCPWKMFLNELERLTKKKQQKNGQELIFKS